MFFDKNNIQLMLHCTYYTLKQHTYQVKNKAPCQKTIQNDTKRAVFDNPHIA